MIKRRVKISIPNRKLERELMALYPQVEKMDPCPDCTDIAYCLDIEDKVVKDCEENCERFKNFNQKCDEMIAEVVAKYKEEQNGNR